MLPDRLNNFLMCVFGYQAATNQKEINRMVECPAQKRGKAAQLHLIGVEQDGERFTSGLLIATKSSVQRRPGLVRGSIGYFQLVLLD